MTRIITTISIVEDDTLADDVIVANELNSVHEIYPDEPPHSVWITPTAAAVGTPRAVDMLLKAALVALDGAEVDHFGPDFTEDDLRLAWEYVTALHQSVTANLPADA